MGSVSIKIDVEDSSIDLLIKGHKTTYIHETFTVSP
jgi:hypothetical protein